MTTQTAGEQTTNPGAIGSDNLPLIRCGDATFDRMVELRRHLHSDPELSWKEVRTTNCLEARLRSMGLQTYRLTPTGVIADIGGPEGVPMVALRADIDALPIQEDTGHEFASRNAGVMHACGHDGHSAMLMGAAERLVACQLPAPVRLIFQPAEEKGSGARSLVEKGALDEVGLIFGCHVDRHFPTSSQPPSLDLANTRGPQKDQRHDNRRQMSIPRDVRPDNT